MNSTATHTRVPDVIDWLLERMPDEVGVPFTEGWQGEDVAQEFVAVVGGTAEQEWAQASRVGPLKSETGHIRLVIWVSGDGDTVTEVRTRAFEIYRLMDAYVRSDTPSTVTLGHNACWGMLALKEFGSSLTPTGRQYAIALELSFLEPRL